VKRSFFPLILLIILVLPLEALGPLSAQAVAIERGQAAPMTATAQAGLPAEPPVTLAVIPLAKEFKAGAPVEVEVRMAAKLGATLEGPLYPQPLGDWAVESVQRETVAEQGGLKVRADRLVLLTYLDGQVEVPSLTVRFRLPNGQAGEVRSAPVTLTVQPATPPAGDPAGLLRDLKKPLGLFPLGQVLLLALLAAAVVGGAWWYARKRKWIGPLVPPAPPRPPEEMARERLAALRASGWLAAGDSKAYYSELSDILRRYLEARFGVAALDRTTQELIRELKKSGTQRQDLGVVRDVLDHSDLAKFAKAHLGEKEADAAWQAVSEWVERTSPRAAAPGSPQAPAEPGGRP